MAEQRTLVVATKNEHKVAEIVAIAGSFGYVAISRETAGIPDFEVEEHGTTFEENSMAKARAIFNYFVTEKGAAVAVLADDSGIEVDALNGLPGVYSARFAEEPEDANDFMAADRDFGQMHRSRQDRANNAKLLRLLEGTPSENRTARFISAITCLLPDGKEIVCRGIVEGRIDFMSSGSGGFGYDPLFIPSGYKRSFGFFTQGDKNAISHRGRALTELAEKLAGRQ